MFVSLNFLPCFVVAISDGAFLLSLNLSGFSAITDYNS